MSKPKYSPGPWIAEYIEGIPRTSIFITEPTGFVVGTCYETDNKIVNIEANANLMAASPKLLELLKDICNEILYSNDTTLLNQKISEAMPLIVKLES